MEIVLDPLVITCIVAVLMLAYLVGYMRRDRRINLENSVLLKTWQFHAAAFQSNVTLHEHILKHAQELSGDYGTYASWSASMHNLLAIFDAHHGVDPDIELQLERMTAKFLSDPNNQTPPPGPLPRAVVLNVLPEPKVITKPKESKVYRSQGS